MENDIDPRFANTFYCVEANSFEHLTLWSQFATDGTMTYRNAEHAAKMERFRVAWKQDNWGRNYTVGVTPDDKPTAVRFFWSEIDGQSVLFYDACSLFVDFSKVEEFLHEHCPAFRKGRHVGAMNFQNALDEIRRETEKQNKKRARKSDAGSK